MAIRPAGFSRAALAGSPKERQLLIVGVRIEQGKRRPVSRRDQHLCGRLRPLELNGIHGCPPGRETAVQATLGVR